MFNCRHRQPENNEQRPSLDSAVLLKFCIQVFFLVAATLTATAQSGPTEYQVKAAFLYNFAKYVEWPTASFDQNSGQILLCVLGEDPFGSTLEETVENRTAQGRKLLVRRLRNADEAGQCHILFVSSSESPRLHDILKLLGRRSILTVGESGDFAQRGGVIRFKTESNRARLEINLQAAGRARLSVSSQLLKLADVVTNAPDPAGG